MVLYNCAYSDMGADANGLTSCRVVPCAHRWAVCIPQLFRLLSAHVHSSLLLTFVSTSENFESVHDLQGPSQKLKALGNFISLGGMSNMHASVGLVVLCC
ncbi:hypothetical protein DUNSADRAFT_15372 [Dunaliella salina]|uniref:Encoded protein n=1 Tax=Dunaliella salina TaxID=3046 RepID=A0ABQ7H1X5_DUNSA|nr:hypothetical protein DUNSADRAFT_15372 [Dunaliella salina]|eukprot:KAF5840830.1 hypothetical protein DUNSADRAFT_15372 [Dunaliella salina]